MCPAFFTCPLEHFPHIFHGDLHQERKVWFWGILLLARNFGPRTFLRIFCFIGIFCFLVIFWPIITSASSPGSPVVEEIGNISWCFQSGSGYAALFQHVNGLDFLSSSFFFWFLFCSAFLEQAFLSPDAQKHFYTATGNIQNLLIVPTA